MVKLWCSVLACAHQVAWRVASARLAPPVVAVEDVYALDDLMVCASNPCSPTPLYCSLVFPVAELSALSRTEATAAPPIDRRTLERAPLDMAHRALLYR